MAEIKNQAPPGPYTACFIRLDGKAIGFHITEPEHGSSLPLLRSEIDFEKKYPPGQIEAIGNLFAAAPQMLAALKKWADFMQANYQGDQDITWWTETMSAIAKAEGRP